MAQPVSSSKGKAVPGPAGEDDVAGAAPDEVFAPAVGLLGTWTLGKFLSTRPPSTVVTLDPADKISHAMREMERHSILSAPVVDPRAKDYMGFLDISNLVFDFVRWIKPHARGTLTASYLESQGEEFASKPIREVMIGTDGQLIYKGDIGGTLLDVVRYAFMQPTGEGDSMCHRCAVFEYDGDDDAMRIQAVVSQTDIIRFLCKHADEMTALMESTLAQLGLAYKEVYTVSSDTPTVEALSAMATFGYRGAGVVAELGGELVGAFSQSDFRNFSPDQFGDLSMPVGTFLKESITRNLPGLGPVTAEPSTTLGRVLELMNTNDVHRIYVVPSDAKIPVGVVSMTDVLRIVSRSSKSLPPTAPPGPSFAAAPAATPAPTPPVL